MRRNHLAVLLSVIVIGGFSLVAKVNLCAAEDATSVSGMINSDTTWTKAGSPFNLTGIVGIAKGVCLTIESGVTVNLGEYSLQIGGTLFARGGSGEENITFVSKAAAYGNIAFANGSSSWDEQNDSGCIIENAILAWTSISVQNSSPKIINNTIAGSINVDYGASPLISNNLIAGDIGVHSSSPIIENNSVIGGINIGGDSPVISNNIIEGGGVSGVGIKFAGLYNINISGNVVYNCSTGISGGGWATIVKNLIIDNDKGLEVSSSRILVQNNTIADNIIGIKIRTNALITSINRNNIQGNTQNSIYLEDSRGDVDATGNWWGTIETQIINLTIHDRDNEPKLGSVTIIPILSAPIPEAPTTNYNPIDRSTLPSQPAQQATTDTSDQSNNKIDGQIGFYQIAVAAIILSVVINISLVALVVRLLRERK